ncbi:MAG: hypothetical protein IT370_30950 [Deltaproteobacteria bacterium]|nr:hypothetical protein [Deltaproteobacteria bacterium]
MKKWVMALGLLMQAAVVASAQPYGPPPGGPPPDGGMYGEGRFQPERDGLMFGAALGFGAVRFGDGSEASEAYGGGGGSFYIGGFLNRNLAIMFDVEASAFSVGRRTDDAVFTSTISTAAVKAYLTENLWLKGGIGWAQLFYQDAFSESQSDPGFGLMAGGGIDVMARRKWALSVELNGAVGSYDVGARDRASVSNGSLLVGLHFY